VGELTWRELGRLVESGGHGQVSLAYEEVSTEVAFFIYLIAGLFSPKSKARVSNLQSEYFKSGAK
jgi:hypothetical protein